MKLRIATLVLVCCLPLIASCTPLNGSAASEAMYIQRSGCYSSNQYERPTWCP